MTMLLLVIASLFSCDFVSTNPLSINCDSGIEILESSSLKKGEVSVELRTSNDSPKARHFVSIREEIKSGANPTHNYCDNNVYIVNEHESRTISVRFNIDGRSQRLNMFELEPLSKKRVICYNNSNPLIVTIIDAKFMKE